MGCLQRLQPTKNAELGPPAGRPLTEGAQVGQQRENAPLTMPAFEVTGPGAALLLSFLLRLQAGFTAWCGGLGILAPCSLNVKADPV